MKILIMGPFEIVLRFILLQHFYFLFLLYRP